jgi:hypothetical protein
MIPEDIRYIGKAKIIRIMLNPLQWECTTCGLSYDNRLAASSCCHDTKSIRTGCFYTGLYKK